jgi:histidinol-phosphate aminotransferase
VVLLRTFSKLFGLAGARIGYLIGPPDLVAVLRKIRPPFSVNVLGQAAAEAAIGDRAYREQARRLTLAMREKVVELFQGAGFECVPSQANFVLVLAPDEEAVVARLRARGVSVRPGAGLGVPGSIRVTIPSPESYVLLEQALR